MRGNHHGMTTPPTSVQPGMKDFNFQIYNWNDQRFQNFLIAIKYESGENLELNVLLECNKTHRHKPMNGTKNTINITIKL